MNTAIVNPSGVQFVRESLTHFPRADRAAADAVKVWLHEQGLDLDPNEIDAVTLHYCFHEGHYIGKVIQSLSLPHAVLSNWQGESTNDLIGAAIGSPWAGEAPPVAITLVDELPAAGLFDNGAAFQVYSGLYRRSNPQVYGPDTHIAIRAESFQHFIWALDFHAPYKQMLDQYWAKSKESYRVAAKINFIAACNRQTLNASLSTAGKRLAWQVAGLEQRPDWQSLGLAPRSESVIEVRPLNVYGYATTDLLCMKNNASGLTVLYIPGNALPLHEFANESLMKRWLASQCQNPQQIESLLSHFAPADRPDGLSYSGAGTALHGLGQFPKPHHFPANTHSGFATSGTWDPQEIINYRADSYSPKIDIDVFSALTVREIIRSYQDAKHLIKNDATVLREHWRGYLDSAVNLLAPLALVIPELAILYAFGGAAQVGLGLDQALHGNQLEDRADGAEQALFGLFNASPLLQSSAKLDHFIYRFKSPRFVAPRRFNDQLGYLLSPMDPPWLPNEEFGAYFHLPHPAPTLLGADPNVAGAVRRVRHHGNSGSTFEAAVDGNLTYLIYDVEQNNFILADDLNSVEPQHFIAPEPPAHGMRPINEQAPPATDLQRTQTLKALGINLELPIDLLALTAATTRAIPHLISSIWVGNKVIPVDLLRNLARNAQILKTSQYRYQLFLSNTWPDIYAQNLKLLRAQAPSLSVELLETHAAYQPFSQSKYFAQYQAAIDGNGGVATNFASASDILRYRILHHQGGLYMDVDDSLLVPGQQRYSPYTAEKIVNEPIDTVDLKTTTQGLLVSDIVNNDRLHMDGKFNNSLFASHAGSPTLDAISEEIYQRYQQNLDFYDSKPSVYGELEAFERYAIRLSQLTGPTVFNDVIDRQLPHLRIARETQLVNSSTILNRRIILDKEALMSAWRELIPLGAVATINSTGSWAHT